MPVGVTPERSYSNPPSETASSFFTPVELEDNLENG